MDEKETDVGRVLLIRREGKILTLLYRGNRLLRVHAYTPGTEILDNIYIGKVKNVVQNIQAAFVEYAPGKLCFLPLKECKEPILTNRLYDGRLLSGDEIVLQISSEKQKTKEAGASCNLSFSGKYLVLTAGRKQTGFSSKLSEAQKKRCSELVDRSPVFAEGQKEYGIIFRTNVKELTELAPLEAELTMLKQEADSLRQTAVHRTCFSLLKKAPASYLKNLQDFYSTEYDKILTDDPEIWKEAEAYLTYYQPSDLTKLTLYEDSMLSLDRLYSVEARLAEALDRKVWLKSGGYLIIDRTEALTCIDVNSGKYTDKKPKEEAYFRINMEAAEEIGHQLQLRNISGIIIIDFINMEQDGQDRKLMNRLREILAGDPLRTTVVDMTPLGLVEVTRKKEKKPLWEQLL